ncbi:hypothetical protein F2Q70_00016825 [Brassica cretica]|uniref:Uncharacterized protein n=1 Tax=Brassica cretica TaxID=69181 RepID=A0A8S9HU03_BRACR|nr:hypothetical protein F2Q70_00016825 [Brassica cretica]
MSLAAQDDEVEDVTPEDDEIEDLTPEDDEVEDVTPEDGDAVEEYEADQAEKAMSEDDKEGAACLKGQEQKEDEKEAANMVEDEVLNEKGTKEEALNVEEDGVSNGHVVGDDVMQHHVNAIIGDDFWQVVKHDKLQEGDFELEIPVDFHVLDIKLNWNSSLLFGRAFLETVGALCNLKKNKLCLTHIDPHVHYNLIPVKKPQMSSRRINDPGIIAACHCGAEYEKEYSASIKTQTATAIDSAHQKSTDIPGEESVDSSPEDWENDYYNPTEAAHTRHNMNTEEYDEDYEEERAAEYKAILDEEDKLLHHSSWKKNAPLIDGTISTSIDTQPHHTNRKRSSTDIAYHPSVDTGVERVREGDYSIGSWADDYHHESYAVETKINEPRADELHEGFTHVELLNMQRRDEADQHQAEATRERTRFNHSIDIPNHTSNKNRATHKGCCRSMRNIFLC